MVYVRYCPWCDAGEPVVAPREHGSSSWSIDPHAFWATAGVATSPAETNGPVPATAGVASATDPASGRRRNGLELWWSGSGGHDPASTDGDGIDSQRTRMDERWAAFAASNSMNDDDDDEMPPSAEGSFVFGSEDIGRRRRLRFARPLRLRQSA
jgi:hypothetical protein